MSDFIGNDALIFARLRSLRYGETVVYHEKQSSKPHHWFRNTVMQKAWNLYEIGHLELVQKVVETNSYGHQSIQYIAIGKKREQSKWSGSRFGKRSSEYQGEVA